MRKIVCVSALVLVCMFFVAGLAYAEATTTHITIYNDTDEPFSFKFTERLDYEGTIQPGDNAYYKDFPTAHLWKDVNYVYRLEFIYGSKPVGEVGMSVTNYVNGMGAALVKHHDTEVEAWKLPFWEHDFSTKGNDVQVNWYLHVRNK